MIVLQKSCVCYRYGHTYKCVHCRYIGVCAKGPWGACYRYVGVCVVQVCVVCVLQGCRRVPVTCVVYYRYVGVCVTGL